MWSKAWWRAGLVGFVLMGIVGCSSPATEQKLILTGSSTLAPLAAELARAFERQHPEIRIDVQSGGSSRGIADVRAGVADIGMVSRALQPQERDLQAHPIAYDGIGLIVHAQNPVLSLSDEQVVAIYTGVIDNWRQVGGPDQPITVVTKAEGRSTLELFLNYFRLRNKQLKADIVIGDNQQGIKTIAGAPGSIGYVSIGSAEFEIGQGAPIRLLPVGGVAATTQAVKRGRFPLARPLNLVTAQGPQGWAKTFIEFAQSLAAQPLVERQFFIPIVADEARLSHAH